MEALIFSCLNHFSNTLLVAIYDNFGSLLYSFGSLLYSFGSLFYTFGRSAERRAVSPLVNGLLKRAGKRKRKNTRGNFG